MTPEQKLIIKEYVTQFDSSIANGEQLDLIIDVVADRVLLYLNETLLDPRLERIVAQVVVANFNTATKPAGQSIAAVSDNGQEVRYHQTPVSYYSSKSDSELFGGFEKLLSSYRRPHVIASGL